LDSAGRNSRDQFTYISLIVVFIALVTGSLGGCSSMMAATSPSDSRNLDTPILSDTIFAIGRLDGESARTINAPDAIAFLGTKNTYMVHEGGQALMQIAAELDGNRITLINPPHTLFLKDETVWGYLSLTYGPGDKQALSPVEIATLLKLGFAAGYLGSHYRKDIYVKGVLFPALALSDQEMQRFKVNRQLDFYDPVPSSPPPPPPDVSYLLIQSLAIALDAAFSPGNQTQTSMGGIGVVHIKFHSGHRPTIRIR
jgi:hypothetical protein